MSKWIYRYLDGARNETDMDFYETQEKAQKESDQHASYGAMTTGAIKVADDYKLYKPDYDKK